MKHFVFIIIFSIASSIALGQKSKNEIEIFPYIRMDWYPKFSYSINSLNRNYVSIKGISWGVNANYKIPIRRSFYLKAGLGYYRYSFNKMDNYTNRFGRNTSRNINYPSNLYIPFYSDKYWYNCFSMNLGIEKIFYQEKKTRIVAGINLNNFYTYFQYYRITADYPTGPPDHSYKLKNKRYFGLSANVNAGLFRKFDKISIGPTLVLPVYDIWKQDDTFPEETNSGLRSKWLNGVGLGISCNYSLTKK